MALMLLIRVCLRKKSDQGGIETKTRHDTVSLRLEERNQTKVGLKRGEGAYSSHPQLARKKSDQGGIETARRDSL